MPVAWQDTIRVDNGNPTGKQTAVRLTELSVPTCRTLPLANSGLHPAARSAIGARCAAGRVEIVEVEDQFAESQAAHGDSPLSLNAIDLCDPPVKELRSATKAGDHEIDDISSFFDVAARGDAGGRFLSGK